MTLSAPRLMLKPEDMVPGEETIVGFGSALTMHVPPQAAPVNFAPACAEALRLAPRGTFVSRVTGACVAPLMQEDDFAILHGAQIERGDLAVFQADGDPFARGKAYLGTCGPSAASDALYGPVDGPFGMFMQWSPFALVLVPLGDLQMLMPVWGRVRDGVVTPFEKPALSRLRADLTAVASPEPLSPIIPPVLLGPAG